MLPYVLIAAVTFITAGLTLFSGFGLGTLLLPVFAVFFPMPVAVALTAVVHLANNLFKLALVGRHAHLRTVLAFGLPALPAALLGAWLLLWLAALPPLATYQWLGRTSAIEPVKAAVALLMIAFALWEIVPGPARLSFPPSWLPLGGLLSGFFGGLSGHQGALRSAFLVRCGLSKEAFIGTGVVIACLVDLSRLSVYVRHFALSDLGRNAPLLVTAVAAAFLGSFLGSRLLKKITLTAVHLLVALMLFLLALALGLGLV
jgi:hypothetical protein